MPAKAARHGGAPEARRLVALRRRVRGVVKAIHHEAAANHRRIKAALPGQRRSAGNLAHYVGLRKQRVRQPQLDLARLGLSSLGRSEGHVRDTLLRLTGWLDQPHSGRQGRPAKDALDKSTAEATLHENTRALFGPHPADRHVYIMLTVPAAAEVTRQWADKVLRAGANVLRINSAHESPDAWRIVAAVESGGAHARQGHPRHGAAAIQEARVVHETVLSVIASRHDACFTARAG